MNQQRQHLDRSLTAAGLTALLSRLDPDPEGAAREYERLRRALRRFFDWRGAAAPEDAADEVIDRLAAKVQTTDVTDVWSYAHGIARLVFFERGRRPVPVPLDPSLEQRAAPSTLGSEPDARLRDCFDLCLAELDEASRSLLLAYYEGERSEKIRGRRHLAERHGLSENALRSRLHRLRERLEQCVTTCTAHERSAT
jgi:DNA-directed RNA polymerase specialized sigma24 family protein